MALEMQSLIEGGTAFKEWAVANDITGGFNDDDDGNGTTNGQEWYFANDQEQIIGLNQTNPNTFEFSHIRPINREEITETHQWSSSMQNWRTADGNETDGTNTVTIAEKTVIAGPGANYETVTLEATVLGPTAPKLFFRLKFNNLIINGHSIFFVGGLGR